MQGPGDLEVGEKRLFHLHSGRKVLNFAGRRHRDVARKLQRPHFREGEAIRQAELFRRTEAMTLLLLAWISLASGNILEEWIAPMSLETFVETFEAQWAHFPHAEPLVPITLEHVAQWLQQQGRQEDVIETLPQPYTRKSFRSEQKDPVRYIQEAFLQGHSMVINSLHRWSEPGARLAKALHAACHLPIDVYTYLTPPYSKSYGLHADVMDAFMVQLAGRKLWKVCDVTGWMAPGVPFDKVPGKLNATCDEIEMKGGDVMYLPYGTLHQASTSSELSMHLTVNVERQFYAWLSVLLAMMHKASEKTLTLDRFLETDFLPDDLDVPAVKSLHSLSPHLPMLHRMPGFSINAGAQMLLMPLCNEDMAPGLLAVLHREAKELLEGLKSEKRFQLRGRMTSLAEMAEQMTSQLTELLAWALQLLRLHAMRNAGGSRQIFQSLSAARRLLFEEGDDERARKLTLSQAFGGLSGQMVMRRPGVKALLLSDELWIDGEAMSLEPGDVKDTLFSLGLFANSSSQGQAFPMAKSKLMQKLLLRGALQLL